MAAAVAAGAAGGAGSGFSSSGEFDTWFKDVPRCAKHHKEIKDRVFLTPISSEQNSDLVLKMLARAPVTGNVIMATASFFALNAVALRGDTASVKDKEVTHIVLTDRSDIQELFWKKMQEILKTTDSRKDVIQKIKDFIWENRKDLFPKTFSYIDPDVIATGTISNLDIEIKVNLSWLSDDERFHKVQDIFRKDHFTYLRVDLTDPASFAAIGHVLTEHSLVVDCMFLSNTRENEYVPAAKLPAYRESVGHVLNKGTLIVDTKDRCCQYVGLLQAQLRKRGEKSLEELFPAMPPCHGHAAGLGFVTSVAPPAYFTWK